MNHNCKYSFEIEMCESKIAVDSSGQRYNRGNWPVDFGFVGSFGHSVTISAGAFHCPRPGEMLSI
jgi:hypothetical protein